MTENEFDWKYDEGRSLQELEEYIESTYSAHYVRDDLTVFDVWKSQGSLETTARDTAQKYLARYGRKNGKDKKDLLKALHYIMLMMHVHNQERAREGAREDMRTGNPRVDSLGPKLYCSSTYETGGM